MSVYLHVYYRYCIGCPFGMYGCHDTNCTGPLQISMCKMRRTRKGGFRRYGDFCEVQLNGSDTYYEVTAKALSTLSGVFDEDSEIISVVHHLI